MVFSPAGRDRRWTSLASGPDPGAAKPDPGSAKYAKNGIAMETLFRLPEAGREAVEPARLKRDDQAIRVNDRCPLPFAG
jgi:hypothetical protein